MCDKENFCKDCKFYTGIHDWNLSCTNPSEERVNLSCCGVLVYDDTPACKNFVIRDNK